ncbi:MAG: histidine kinase, partial [Candidatus Berkelbacteria bacterium Gr01-1014_85]
VFTKDDIQFLDIIAKQTASAIEKSRFYQDDQLKSEFVSIASHELLTPTAAIQGYLSMILDEKMAQVDPKAEEYLRKVQNSAHRLAELVTDLLSVSRIEGGRIVINKAPQAVAPLLKQVIDEIKVKADMAHIQLSVEANSLSNLPLIMTDPDRFIQIAMNLISNAIKYGRAGGQVRISAESDTQNQMVVVHVSDNGIGIPAEHLPHLFEKFYRVHDDSAAAEKVGTGLGLYITRSIVELQGGRIWVRSEAGRGSQFSFSLPFAKPAEIQATGPAERATISTTLTTTPTH